MTMAAAEHDGSVVWAVEGEIDLASAPEFERCVVDSGAEGRPVVVDLGRVRYLDSAGLASLVRLHLQLDRRGSGFGVLRIDRRSFHERNDASLLTQREIIAIGVQETDRRGLGRGAMAVRFIGWRGTNKLTAFVTVL